MSDLPLPAGRLECIICSYRTFDFRNLRRHQRAAHGRVSGDGPHRQRLQEPSPTLLALQCAVGGEALSASIGVGRPVGGGQGSGDGVGEDEGSSRCAGPVTDDPTGMAATAGELKALIEMTRLRVNEKAAGNDYGRGLGGAGDEDETPEYTYSTIATHVRVLYEELKDVQRSTPLASVRRKTPHTGKFKPFRLHALQQHVLEAGCAGLSLSEQSKIFEFLDVWDRTKEGMPKDAGNY